MNNQYNLTVVYTYICSDTSLMFTACRANLRTSSEQSSRYVGFGHTAEKSVDEHTDNHFMEYLSSVSGGQCVYDSPLMVVFTVPLSFLLLCYNLKNLQVFNL